MIVKKTNLALLVCSLVAAPTFITSAQAANIANANYVLTDDLTANDNYFFTDGINHTWEVNGNITVGSGSTAVNGGRLFIGSSNTTGVTAGNGVLTLTSTLADSTLFLDGYDSGDQIIGRLGRNNGLSGYTAILNIEGGLDVIMAGRKFKYAGMATTHYINITNGSLDYSATGFHFDEIESGTSNIIHVIGANGALILDGEILDLAAFDSWATSDGVSVETNDIKLLATENRTLNFSYDSLSDKTTITTIPEPSAALLGGLGMLALLRRRRA